MTGNTSNDAPEQGVPASSIFRTIEQGAAVVSAALQHRANASNSARDALNAAIDAAIALPGFMNPSVAQPALLNGPVAGVILDNDDRLAGAVLRVWAESRPDVAALVAEHLRGQGVAVDDLAPRREYFDAVWPQSACFRERDAIIEQHSGLDPAEVMLMLCCLSGRFPEEERGVASPLFSEWLAKLRDLPHDAPDWDEADRFIADVARIVETNASERVLAQQHAVDEAIADVTRLFGDDLYYLDIDIGSWPADAAARPDLVPEAQELARAMRSELQAYREIRPQALTRADETARAAQRNEREQAILGIVAAWLTLMNTPEPPDAEPDASEEDEASAASDQAPRQLADTVSWESYQAIQAAMDAAEAEAARLRGEYEALQHSNEGLRGDKERLNVENSDLRGALYESKQREETWLAASIAERRQTGAVETEQQPITSVRGALSAAEEKYSRQLLVALNSKSNEDSSYQHPEEVFQALAWLATEYHPRRINPGANPEFDRLIREACPGWSYTPHTSGITIGMYPDWYETRVSGKTYRLFRHIGKGNSGDPQHTIRIAFDWDGSLQKVIVGYVGLHQPTQDS